MSTRSGKRIHVSSHEDIVKSEADIIKSERKTRRKHSKENVDELNLSPKNKKRNYVAYPSEDDSGSTNIERKEEGRTTRSNRKNALSERNFASSTESAEPSRDSRKSVRSTRKIRKGDDTEEVPEVTEHEPVKPDSQKLRKGKKKKKLAKDVTETVSKKKSKKKKKGRRSSSIVIEDIEPVSSGLNKSNMSVDSFHSAAGSPPHIHKCDDEPASIENVLDQDIVNKNTSIESIIKEKTERRPKRSTVKLNCTLTGENDNIEPRNRRSSVKLNLNSTESIENDDMDNTLTKQLQKCRSSLKELLRLSSERATDCKNSTLHVDSQDSQNATFDKTITPVKNVEVKVSASKGKKRKSCADEIATKLLKPQENTNTIYEKDDIAESANKGKKRKSAINANNKITQKSSPLQSDKEKLVINTTFEKEEPISTEKKSLIDATFDIIENASFKSSPIKLATEDNRRKSVINVTFEKDSETSSDQETIGKKTSDTTFDITVTSSPFKSAEEVSSPSKMITLERKSIIDTTFEKDSDIEIQGNIKRKSTINTTIEKDGQEPKNNMTFEKDKTVTSKTEDEIKNMRKSLLRLSSQVTHTEINNTINIDEEKILDATFDKCSKSSLISSDNSMITLDKSEASRISITDDESRSEENVINITPVLIESSIDESQVITPNKKSPESEMAPITPLKREGTFTKDEPEVSNSPKSKSLSKTPTKRMSLSSPGFTPFHVNKSSSREKIVLNVTRSIEKSRHSSLAEPVARTTKVMFCSPVNNPAVVIQQRRKVIKSNLKGSNKSFVFDDSVCVEPRGARKRSYTHSDAEDARVKRTRLAPDLHLSVERLSRPRAASASAKAPEPTTPSKKPTTPSKKLTTPSKKDKVRTKLPNFAALHQKQFSKMESLNECQERKAKRAKQLLTPTGAVNMLDRISPKDKVTEPEKPSEAAKKPDTPVKSLPTLKSLNPGYSRFGFKLNLDVNPFSIPTKKPPQPKENKPNGVIGLQAGVARKAKPGIARQTLPSLIGTTSVRREVAKQTIMREKSFTDKRNVKRTENRTVIKGVRTNRRFELQMKMRDL